LTGIDSNPGENRRKPAISTLYQGGQDMVMQQMQAMTEAKSTTETRRCPFCSEILITGAITCSYCGCDLPVLAPSPWGWISVAEYAAATSKSEEDVISAIHDGDLDGRLVGGIWMVLYE
jgi:hypothetical protein